MLKNSKKTSKILKKNKRIHRFDVCRVQERPSAHIFTGLFFQMKIFLLKSAEEKSAYAVVASNSIALNGFVAPATPTTRS